jgi:AraC-like DNA-binding protein
VPIPDEPADPRGLHGRWTSFQRFGTLPATGRPAGWVDHYWFACWDLRGQPAYRQRIAPAPNVQLSFVFGDGGDGGDGAGDPVARVHGVARGRVVRTLAGLGHAFGVAFRAGCFRPLLGRPVSEITGRSLPATEVFGAGVPVDELAAAGDEHGRRAVVQRFLLGVLPDRDPAAERAAGIVAAVQADPGLVRVDQLAARHGLSVRALQRLFADQVGVSPKWMIRWARLRELTDRLAAGGRVDWAVLAAELGYADQAHLSRDFRALVGEPPTSYAGRYPSAARSSSG